MLRTLWTVTAVGLVVVGIANCGGGSGGGGSSDLAGSVCKKADSCNALSGITAARCKDLITTSLQSATSAARADAEKALNACLTTADCNNVGDCIDAVLRGGSGNTGGASGGSTAGGSGGSTGEGSGGSSGGGAGGSTGGGSTGVGVGGSADGGSSVIPAGGSGGKSVVGSGGSTSGGGTSGGSAGSRSGGTSGGNTGGSGAGNTSTSAAGSTGSGTGGQTGASGGSTGSGSTEPELITSAANAYWTKGQVTKVASGTADLNVDKNTTFQRWDGFGGTFNEMGWDALSVVSSEIPNAIKLLFDPNDGANFAYGRIPLGASDYSMSWYTLAETAGDYAMDKFSIARDKEKLIPFIKEALKLKPGVHLWASPWVVPSWMMDSSSNMKSDAQTQGAHALYMARFVEEYAKEGLKIEAIHPQNEPGYARVHWTQSLLINFMKTYLGPTLAQRNLTTQVWCGTMSKDPDDTNIAKATALDADAMKYVKGFGVQWNLQAAVVTLAAKGPVMQTEHRCGNYNFESPYWDKSRYSSSKAQNDHLYGEESWQLIRDWIVSGVNSYSAWNMVLDTNGKSLDGWPQNALLVVDRTAKKLIVTPVYYVFRHFSQYIAVGATRIGTTGSSDAFAFKNPDGSIIAQVYNKAASSKKMTVGVGSALSQTLYQFDVPAHGWATLRVSP
jgi:glucosylceramidase